MNDQTKGSNGAISRPASGYRTASLESIDGGMRGELLDETMFERRHSALCVLTSVYYARTLTIAVTRSSAKNGSAARWAIAQAAASIDKTKRALGAAG